MAFACNCQEESRRSRCWPHRLSGRNVWIQAESAKVFPNRFFFLLSGEKVNKSKIASETSTLWGKKNNETIVPKDKKIKRCVKVWESEKRKNAALVVSRWGVGCQINLLAAVEVIEWLTGIVDPMNPTVATTPGTIACSRAWAINYIITLQLPETIFGRFGHRCNNRIALFSVSIRRYGALW